MKFESLPNEVLIQCFEYLGAIELFHSFDYLNWRFFTLIRSISLHLDLGILNNLKLTQFSIKLSSNPQMKEQITSLILQNSEAIDNIQKLSPFVSLNELPHVQTLVLSDLDKRSINQLSSSLPLLPNLRYISIDIPFQYGNEILRLLSNSTVERLLIKKFPRSISLGHSFVSLTHLTISSCDIDGLCQLFTYVPILHYLNIGRLDHYRTSFDQSQLPQDQLIYLERLIVDDLHGNSGILEILARRTPNLKFLALPSYDHLDTVDASRWRELIEKSWPLLEVFRFVCRFRISDEAHDIVHNLRLFQTDFWYDRHNWYIEYVLNEQEAFVYTIPYVSQKYTITSNTKRYVHPFNSSKVFTKVTNLTLYIAAMNAIDRYHFPNVKSLTLTDGHADVNVDYFYLPQGEGSALKMMASLPNLTDLRISSACRKASDPIILQLLYKNAHLSSLKTGKTVLHRLLNNSQSYDWCKLIKNLHITGDCWTRDFSSKWMMKLCAIFCNMEEFRCKINERDILKIVIHHLSQLPCMRVFHYKTYNLTCIDGWLGNDHSELELCSFKIHCDNRLQRLHRMGYLDSDSD